MKTLARILSVLIVLPILASCSTQSSNEAHVKPADSDTHTAADAPNRGIYLESGEFIEFGTFNKHAVDLFDPCQELPLEALTAIGFPAGERPESSESAGVVLCIEPLTFDLPDNLDSATLGVTTNVKEDYRERGFTIYENVSVQFPEIYALNVFEGVTSSECEAVVDTAGGSMYFAMASIDSTIEQEMVCQLVVERLENLILSSGEK